MSLEIVSLDDGPVYTALSYAWGRNSATEKIILDGVELWVRPNLHAFLGIMHNERWDFLIFIDALCIDQNDTAERNHQVGLMRDVYRDAELVIAWLGTERNRTDWLANWADDQETREWIEAVCESEEDLALLIDRAQDDDFYDFTSNTVSMRAIIVILDTFSNPNCCSRLWIVQEIILAKRLMLLCGKVRLRPEELKQLISCNQHWRHRQLPSSMGLVPFGFEGWACPPPAILMDDSDWGPRAAFKTLLQRETISGPIRYMHFDQAVTLFSTQKCSVPHDKLFGLLRITDSLLFPDYGMPILELYVSALIEATLCSTTRRAITGPDRRSDRLDIQLALVRAPDIRPYHPTAALVTRFVGALCEQRREDLYTCNRLTALHIKNRSPHKKDERRKRIWKSIATIRCTSTELRLRHYRERNTKLPAYEGAEPKTWNEWLKTVVDIFITVRKRMGLPKITQDEIYDLYYVHYWWKCAEWNMADLLQCFSDAGDRDSCAIEEISDDTIDGKRRGPFCSGKLERIKHFFRKTLTRDIRAPRRYAEGP